MPTMRQNSLATIFFALLTVILLLYISTSNSKRGFGSSAVDKVSRNFSAWHDCLSANISSLEGNPEDLWWNLKRGIKLCENIPEMEGLIIGDYPNSDEIKRHMVPKTQQSSVIVTLGIGHDTIAETRVQKDLPHGVEYFGADPMHEINEDLYTKLPGKYFPFAVGESAGLADASVLINTTYVTRTVVNVDIIYFLKNLVQRTFIDDLWIDGEGAEFGLFDHFYNDGKFDQAGITLCQFNIEIHMPDTFQKQLFHDFIFRLMKDRRYGIYRVFQRRHMRLFMLNFANEECVYKYIL